MKFTKVAADLFKKLQLNAGVLLHTFDPEAAEMDRGNIIGATNGGVTFTATPTFSDRGADIDNVPDNMMELKELDNWSATMSGTYVTIDANQVKSLLAAADVEGDAITPRNDLDISDFEDVWWVGDYSDDNSEESGGMMAIHIINALSTGGFSVKSSDDGKGMFSFTYTAHYSLADPEKIPFEIFVRAGSATENE